MSRAAVRIRSEPAKRPPRPRAQHPSGTLAPALARPRRVARASSAPAQAVTPRPGFFCQPLGGSGRPCPGGRGAWPRPLGGLRAARRFVPGLRRLCRRPHSEAGGLNRVRLPRVGPPFLPRGGWGFAFSAEPELQGRRPWSPGSACRLCASAPLRLALSAGSAPLHLCAWV